MTDQSDARKWLNARLGKQFHGTINGKTIADEAIYLDPAGFPDVFELRLTIKDEVAMLDDFTASLRSELARVTAERDEAYRQCGRGQAFGEAVGRWREIGELPPPPESGQ